MPDDIVTQLDRGRPVTDTELLRRADWIRLQTIDLIRQAGLGHYSSTFSSAEIIATLYYRALRLRPEEPRWADRDRFLLGKGHVATGLWPVLADLGFYPQDWLGQFGKVGSPLNDHPNMKLAHGIDFSSGSLGHNLSVGVGMALGARLTGRDYRTFVLTGDGELQEGQVWEAAMAASHYKLGNLIAIVDANGFSGAGPTSQAINIEPLGKRFEAFGWTVREIDGNDIPDGQVHPRRAARPVERGADRDHRPHPQGARRRVHGEAAAGLAPGPAQRRAVRRRGRRDHRADGV